jgi:hypothetical protein
MTIKKVGGRPKLPPVVVVKIAEADHELAYKLLGVPLDTPFREVFHSLIEKVPV